MEITTVYQKERKDFGRSVHHLAATGSQIMDEFLPDEILLKEQYIERSPTILDIQAIPDMSEVYVNTETVTYKTQGMLHVEGGWPKDVDPTEKDQTQCARARRELVAAAAAARGGPWPAAACSATPVPRRWRAPRALAPPPL